MFIDSLQAIWLSAEDDLKKIIETATSGQTIHLFNGDIHSSETINIPSGVTIIGEPNTRIILNASENSQFQYIFSVSNKANIEINSIKFELSGRAGVVQGLESENITLTRLTIEGDMATAHLSSAQPPAGVIYFKTAQHISVTDCLFLNTRSGIYTISSTDVLLANNILDNVYFGQFNVSGSRISVLNNYTNEAGQSNIDGLIPQGDSITVFDATQVLISNNYFTNSKCYQINFVSGVNNDIIISNNSFVNGITSAIYAYANANISNLQVTNNLFNGNNGSAAGFELDVTDLSFINNSFIGDGVIINGNHTNLLLSGNSGLTYNPDQVYDIIDVWEKSYLQLEKYPHAITNIQSGVGSNVNTSVTGVLADAQAQNFISTAYIALTVGSSISLSTLISIASDILEVQILDANKSSGTAYINNLSFADNGIIASENLHLNSINAASYYSSNNFYLRVKTNLGWSEWGSITVETFNSPSNNIVFHVDQSNDIVKLPANSQGTVVSSASWFHLPNDVNNLTLIETAWGGWGNDSSNVLIGNNRDNSLSGNDGNDLLLGGDGNDYLEGQGGVTS